MDKKNTIIGVTLLLAAFVCYYLAPKSPPPPAPTIGAPTQSGNPTTQGNQAPGPATGSLPSITSPTDAAFGAVSQDDRSARVLTLENEFVQVRFTDFGGAIKDVAFKKYPAQKDRPDPVVFNDVHVDPILAFTRDSFPGLDRSVRYDVVSSSSTEVIFKAVFENRVEVTRRYALVAATPGDPYLIRHETTFRNLSDQTTVLPRLALSLGTTALLDDRDLGQYLNIGYNNGDDFETVKQDDLKGGGFLSGFGLGRREDLPFFEASGPILWGAAKNQYFASIVTPDQPASGLLVRLVKDLPGFAGSTRPNAGMTGSLRFDVPALAPQTSAALGMNLYVGPKEYRRLANTDVFKHDEDKVMDYTSFFFNRIFLAGYFAPLMNQLMNWTASWVHNWGWAIIIGTLLIKIVTLPFNLSAARAGKRMQKLQPQMKAIREKYKDNPQKLQQANVELFKQNKVNPLGSCLPVLIPLPFFIGFFAMLWSAPELRFQEFLWVDNLAGPDTVAVLSLGSFKFPLNILPLLLGATMIVQMRLVPQPGAMDTDQAKMMAKMMKWMPLIYVVFCYNFSCALALYSTVNGLFMIAQQLVVNRMKDPEFSAATTPRGAAMETLKNVTPSKKKKRK